MGKMTDEQVAEALGWKAVKFRMTSSHNVSLKGLRPGGTKTPCAAPAFTTSLDAIVAEIEARVLPLTCHVDKTGAWAEVDSHREYGATLPLALCAALLTYIKERHD